MNNPSTGGVSYRLFFYINDAIAGMTVNKNNLLIENYPVLISELQSCYHNIASERHQPMNYNVTPDMVAPRTNEIIIHDDKGKAHRIKPAWKCSKCGHIWKATISSRTMNKTGCPKCWQSSHKSKQEDEVAAYIENYLVSIM